MSNLTDCLGKTSTAPGSGFVLYQWKRVTNHPLMLRRRISTGLEKTKFFAIFLRQPQPGQSPHILHFCSMLVLPLVTALKVKQLSHTRPHQWGIETLELKPELNKGVQGCTWRHNCRHPARSMPSSSLRSATPLPAVVVAVLSHEGSLSEHQHGWINEVCHNQLLDNAVRLQNRFKISHPVTLKL